jgi:hypothetical protein
MPPPGATTGSITPGKGAGNGAPAAWDEALPTELAARAAAQASAPRYRPANPDAPMIGDPAPSADATPTPIFDTVSLWFTDEPASRTPSVIDLRDSPSRVAVGSGSAGASGGGNAGRWATLGDQRWQATNARAAATPEIAGTTEVGLPRRRPGANLLPSAAAAAPPSTPAARPDGGARRPEADVVRGRLGSYQRGLSSARRARHLPDDPRPRQDGEQRTRGATPGTATGTATGSAPGTATGATPGNKEGDS